MEKIMKPVSGYFTLLIALICLGIGFFLLVSSGHDDGFSAQIPIGLLLMITGVFLLKGITVINPNQSNVCTLFGKYIGTVKDNGLLFVNPFYRKQRVSLRANNFESPKLKVNDETGNPIEISAVVVWQVNNTYRAAFEVNNYEQYVKLQSETAIRHLASICPYDEYENAEAAITLRKGGEKVNALLETELNERLAAAGIMVKEARISHLAYAPEIAGDMLRRQQATAVVAARFKIVEGAVSMVELALEQLSKKEIVKLDEERKAAMVSNLMVVLCGEKSATPVVNTGTLYQ